MERKVDTAYLKIGMYVAKLDRPWRETPFLLQGFYIVSDEEILQLGEFCKHVFIDVERGVDADMYPDEKQSSPAVDRMKTNPHVEEFLESGKKQVNYVEEKSTLQELPDAKLALEEANERIAAIMEQDLRNNKLNVEAVKGAVQPIVDSMVRNSDAFVWLTKMRQHDKYTYDHSVENCALGIAFGRHMGLHKSGLQTLAMGLLLMDVGKTRLSKELLTKKSALTDEEFEEMKKHVDHSVDILRNTDGINENIINIALTHHEHYDGTGYPNGLVGVQTPVFGRMAAIIDSYDAMTTSTPYRKAISEHKALQNLYNLRDKHFQQELVEQFLQCMGVYPTGSLVELTTGEVGIVLSQNSSQRLKPRVMLLLDDEKQRYSERRVVNLAEQDEDASGAPFHIAKSLDDGEYGVNAAAMGL